ncbi:bifunctional cobalt-precorrin-7 (C(5))-methyltransferase/cobalt-precorrin-6B (C(15))-methyltransferase [Microlunatus endophyticus]
MVGVPARGLSTLDPASRSIVARARVIVAGSRLLAEVTRSAIAIPDAELVALPSPLRAGLVELVEGRSGQQMVLLASGDPLVAGIGRTAIELFGTDRVRIHPAVSSVALARARLGWPAETCESVRVSRGAYEVVAQCRPDARLVVLSWDRDSPAEIAARLTEAGFGSSRMIMLSDLGTDQETRLDGRAGTWDCADVPALELVCVECLPDRDGDPALWSTAPGLPDDAFDHDGQLTKRYLRAAALTRLRPVPGELLWDLGAGAGSVGIEWCRQDPRNRAVAVERDPERAARITNNARRLGAIGIQVVTDSIDAALDTLTRPDAVFVGGGVTAGIIDRAMAALPHNGRLVAHAVTVESESLLLAASRRYGGDLSRIGIEALEPLGSYLGWKPARSVTQWAVTKRA